MIASLIFLNSSEKPIEFDKGQGKKVFIKRQIQTLDESGRFVAFSVSEASYKSYAKLKMNAKLSVDLVYEPERAEFVDGLLMTVDGKSVE